MQNIIFGIDGGGTKSHMAVFDQSGQCLAVGVHGPLNHECMEGSFRQLEGELTSFILETLYKIDATPADVAFAVMGIAGVDTKKQHAVIAAMVDHLGLNNYILCNDGFLGVAGGCPGGVGICAINGTGSTMAAIDHSGNTLQVCGIGELSNDCGGGSWYGPKMLGAVYGELFKCEPKTALTGILFDHLGIKTNDDYVEMLTASIEDELFSINEFNRLLFPVAAAGDEVALRIIEESADHYAGGIAHLATTLDFPTDQTLSVTLAGSIFTKEKVRVLPEMLARKVAERLQDYRVSFHTLRFDPVVGAVYWASREAGLEWDVQNIAEEIKKAGL
jgi:N-acetylglucosamine kinase-like BadF-type ATPase